MPLGCSEKGKMGAYPSSAVAPTTGFQRRTASILETTFTTIMISSHWQTCPSWILVLSYSHLNEWPSQHLVAANSIKLCAVWKSAFFCLPWIHHQAISLDDPDFVNYEWRRRSGCGICQTCRTSFTACKVSGSGLSQCTSVALMTRRSALGERHGCMSLKAQRTCLLLKSKAPHIQCVYTILYSTMVVYRITVMLFVCNASYAHKEPSLTLKSNCKLDPEEYSTKAWCQPCVT